MTKCDKAYLMYLPLSLCLFREHTIFDHRCHSHNNHTDGVTEVYEQEDDETTE